jgi:hypothetical protein
MKRIILKQESPGDYYYTIVWEEHDNLEKMIPTEYGQALFLSERIVSDGLSCVEGLIHEIDEIAQAILTSSIADFKRCAVDATGNSVLFWSPRNSNGSYGEVSREVALEFADHVFGVLAKSRKSN